MHQEAQEERLEDLVQDIQVQVAQEQVTQGQVAQEQDTQALEPQGDPVALEQDTQEQVPLVHLEQVAIQVVNQEQEVIQAHLAPEGLQVAQEDLVDPEVSQAAHLVQLDLLLEDIHQQANHQDPLSHQQPEEVDQEHQAHQV